MNKIKDRLHCLFPKVANEIENIFDFEKLDFLFDFFCQDDTKGFFSKGDQANILDRHIIEPIYHLYLLDQSFNFSSKTKICDCGTGMGIPGIFFFCFKKKLSITLLDSQKKKLSILQKAIEKKYPLSEVHFLYERAEESRKKFDFVISRAFLPYPFCAEIVTSLVKKGGYYLPFLGRLACSDFEKKVLNKNGFLIKKKIQLDSLAFLGKRHIIFLEKISNPKFGYPRQWKTISKKIREHHEKNNIHQ